MGLIRLFPILVLGLAGFAHSDEAPNPQVNLFTGLNGRVTALAFSPRRGLVAAGAEDGSLLIRSWMTGDLVYLGPSAHKGALTALCFNVEGTRLATAGADGLATVLSLADPSHLALSPPLGAPAQVLAYSAGDDRFYAGLAQGGLVSLDPQRAGMDFILPNPGGSSGLTALWFSADGSHFATGYGNGQVAFWSGAFRKVLWQGPAGQAAVVQLAAAGDDDKYLVALGQDGNSSFFTAQDGTLKLQKSLGEGRAYVGALSADVKTAVLGQADGSLGVFSLPRGDSLASTPSGPGTLTALATEPKGMVLALGFADGKLEITRNPYWFGLFTQMMQKGNHAMEVDLPEMAIHYFTQAAALYPEAGGLEKLQEARQALRDKKLRNVERARQLLNRPTAVGGNE